ncbi:MAG: AsmA family protein [Gammaproteobacteria bacterium]|nr:AsmA family protein [Gammaproteobacteria bacterium]MBU0788806.1 AsmA family protein [Gammaproteobacteria bacterium]MBU0814574.1 AsmA family protein [Gammaproteobacteria bacterium]MBU1786583.1 AsmA family protein [Gammaproteobacteria bacterium]
MPKILKYLLVGAATILVLLLAGIAIIASTFNPNDYKPHLINLVHERTQRTLAIPGDITLSYFPNIGANLGKITLSEPNSEQLFASGEQASVSLALMPIFSNEFVVKQLNLDGLTVNIQRNKDGSSNLSDLLPKDDGSRQPDTSQPTEAQPVKLDVGGIAITHASLTYTDEATRRKLALRNFQLISGPIASGKPSHLDISGDISGDNPRLALKVQLKSKFTLNLEQQHYVLNDLDVLLEGSAADVSSLQLKLSAPSAEATPVLFKVPSPGLSLTLDGKSGDRAFKGRLGTELIANLKTQMFELNGLNAEMALPNPAGGTLALQAKGQASINPATESIQAFLAGKLDSSSFDAKLGFRNFAQPAYNFDITIDDIDVDRYTTNTTQQPEKSTATSPAPSVKNVNPIDLSALKTLNARGKLQVNALNVANIKASRVKLELQAGNGKVHINPLSASLYGGSLAGTVTANATTPPRFASTQTLRGAHLGPLLQDATGSAPLDGLGDVVLDLSSTGDTVSQLKKGLNGTARFELKDGAIKGINIAEALRNAKAKIGLAQGSTGAQQGSGSAQDKTDFSELSGSFRISNGIATNHDLSGKTPLLRLGGDGDINLGEDRLDYTLKATVVPTLQGQGGPELQALKGLTIPVKLSGSFSAIDWKVDFAAMAGELAKGKVDEKKAQIKAQAQQKLDEQKDKVQDMLKGGLKGLFGK